MYLKVLQSTSNSYRFVYKLSSPWYFSALKKRGDPGYPCHSLYTLEERSSGSSSPVRLSPEDALFQDAPLFLGAKHCIQVCPKISGLHRSIPILFGWDWKPQSNSRVGIWILREGSLMVMEFSIFWGIKEYKCMAILRVPFPM